MATRNEQITATIQRLGESDVGKARDRLLDGLFWDEVGTKLTCFEAEALGVLLIHAGAFDGTVASLIVEGHGPGDCEPTDLHGHEEVE